MNRDELIKELKNDLISIDSALWIENVASWIIKNNQRIVEPLVRYKSNYIPPKLTSGYKWGTCKEDKFIEEALQLAGVKE